MSSDSEDDFTPSVKKAKKTTTGGGRGRKKKDSATKKAKLTSPKRKKGKNSTQSDRSVSASRSKKPSKTPPSKSKKSTARFDTDDEDGNSTSGGAASDDDFGEEEEKDASNTIESESDNDVSFTTSRSNNKSKTKKPKENKKKPTKKKGGSAGGDDARSAILHYMKVQNRPYSTQVVFDNLHGKIKKGLVQKTLDSLVDEKELQVKEYGKAKIYLFNQNNIDDFDQKQLDDLKVKLNEKKEIHAAIAQEIKELTGNVKNLDAQLTNEQLEVEIEKYNGLIDDAHNKLAFFMSEDFPKIDDDAVQKAEAKLREYELAYKKRKNICKRLLGSVCEMTEMKMNKVIETIGIDED